MDWISAITVMFLVASSIMAITLWSQAESVKACQMMKQQQNKK